MMRTIISLLAIILSGCTYQWQTQDTVTQSTYSGGSLRSENSVGKLRRLALMPVELKFYTGHMIPLKDNDLDDSEVDFRREQFRDKCIQFLTESKGYEVITVPDGDSLLNGWIEGQRENQDPATVRHIGHSLNVDGLMVVEIQEERMGSVASETVQASVNLLLLNIPMFTQIASPDLRVWIYETSTGKPVWSRKGAVSNVPEIYDSEAILNDFVNLLSVMENALPAQLIE